VGATLSVIGAVVGELVGADKGLGFLINLGAVSMTRRWSTCGPSAGWSIMALLALTGSVLLLEKRHQALADETPKTKSYS
jgi:NitT/TauT family transport system permease protein